MDDPVLFLDIDGVLNSVQHAVMYNKIFNKSRDPYREDCCVIALSNLEEVIKHVPKTKIVISSTWRIGSSTQELQDLFKKWGFKYYNSIIGKTPVTYSSPRGEEIQQYIDKYNVKNYCIVDDDSDMLDSQKHRFVQTNNFHGLLWKEAHQIVEILKG